MSFTQNDSTSRVYAPGYFLASEICERTTRTISATAASVKTASNGGKFVPCGTIYPNNDSTAVGIVYEDVDVTTGDMPGSVVLKGTVYENRLSEAVDTYGSVTVPTGGNPKELGLYERSGTSPNYVYTLTTDTTAASGKTYYSYDGKWIDDEVKAALEAKGFVFETEPTVTRPE